MDENIVLVEEFLKLTITLVKKTKKTYKHKSYLETYCERVI